MKKSFLFILMSIFIFSAVGMVACDKNGDNNVLIGNGSEYNGENPVLNDWRQIEPEKSAYKNEKE